MLPPDYRYRYACLVTQVIDGDTVVADIDLGFGIWLRNQRLRLAGIDTPERGQPGAAEAAARLRDLVAHRPCLALTSRDRGDKYGRYLVRLYPDSGFECVNDVLLAEGLARPYGSQGSGIRSQGSAVLTPGP